MHQEIKYCITSDGVRLAYSVIGKGTPIVRLPHWFAHLECDLESPIFRHQIWVWRTGMRYCDMMDEELVCPSAMYRIFRSDACLRISRP